MPIIGAVTAARCEILAAASDAVRLASGLAMWIRAVPEGAAPRTRVLTDIVLRGGLVYDGTGAPPVCSDVVIAGERVVGMGTDVGKP